MPSVSSLRCKQESTKMYAQDFEAAVNTALNEKPENQQLARDFLSAGTDIQRYVVGRNDQSTELIKAFQIVGVIDDYEKKLTRWNGVPILASSMVPKNAVVVNCSTSISPISVNANLLKAGVTKVISINELILASNGIISWPWFVKQQREHFQRSAAEWSGLYESMADEESRQTLLDVMRYRVTANPKYMQGYQVRLNDQYFEAFLDLESEVFVDAGGFDGDTTEGFCKRYPDYRKVYLFEPSLKNMQAAQARLGSFININFLALGLSDQIGVLHFNPDAGSASAVSVDGNEKINVTTLDEEVREPVSFIKMDLEGWEMKALAGCSQHIRDDKPKLAISVYHGASDFIEIPRFVLSLNPEYRIYLRHYTQGWSETVMYFLQ